VNSLVAPDTYVNERLGELQALVRTSSKIHVVGSRSKSGFHPRSDDATTISTQSLSGVVSYDPLEFVVTVLGGTPVLEVDALLAKHGQYLPFDPLLVDRGATIGGTVASNAAGPGRFRFGGIRDFLLGVRFMDGRGNCIRGGGQVVKNAAGFDYPKLMVGSCGTLGLLYELTFKVFPKPESYATIIATFPKLEEAVACMNTLAVSPMDIEAIELIPIEFNARGYELAIRIGGIASALTKRLNRLKPMVPVSTLLRDQDDWTYWRAATNLEWARDKSSLVKIPITPTAITLMEKQLSQSQVDRRYSVGGNVAWIARALPAQGAHPFSNTQTFLGPLPDDTIGKPRELGPFGRAIKVGLDPESKFI
jgi:glycolate oxidase FAD binding subunit